MIFCPLFSGSSGNSIFVSSGTTRILIDAGLSGKTIENALLSIDENCSNINGIFITHEHSDHIKGVGVLSRRYDIPIYANEDTWNAMKNNLGKIKENNIKIIDNGHVSMEDMDIETFTISHDAAAPVGYAIKGDNKKVCVATDMGYFSEEVKEALYDADAILMESNHDIEMLKFGPYPYVLKRRILSNIGHLSNEDCGRAISEIIMKSKFKKIILGHLSKTNNYPELAHATVVNVLKDNGIDVEKDLILTLAKRDMPSSYINI